MGGVGHGDRVALGRVRKTGLGCGRGGGGLSVPSLVINTSSGANRHKNVNRLKFRKLI